MRCAVEQHRLVVARRLLQGVRRHDRHRDPGSAARHRPGRSQGDGTAGDREIRKTKRLPLWRVRAAALTWLSPSVSKPLMADLHPWNGNLDISPCELTEGYQPLMRILKYRQVREQSIAGPTLAMLARRQIA
jgi:hypothetical protein